MSIHIEQHSPAFWRVTFDNPANVFDQKTVDELESFLTKLDADENVKIIVFESATPDYLTTLPNFATEFDSDRKPVEAATVSYLLKRMEHSEYVTVGVLRGHACGISSEFLLGLDVRFASGKAVFSQIGVNSKFFADADRLVRLCQLIGRARTLEMILGAEDLDADTAERYGWINRSIPDEHLDAFIERFAHRISNLDHQSIALTKQITGEQIGSAQFTDSDENQSDSFKTLSWSEIQEQTASPAERAMHDRGGDREIILGEQLRPESIY